MPAASSLTSRPPAWHDARAMATTKVYQYPKCSTCRKALKWLDGQGVRYEKTDLVATPPSLPALAYVTLVTAANGLSAVRVYPSPWKSTEHADKDIIFDGLPPNSTVKIFTVTGQHVITLQATTSQANWKLKNDHGENVASGIYLYLITDDQVGKLRGKIAVIR